ncbi:hypothetical protein MKJ04_05840 [Pontibacter sp. E15-1]|uniref:hypothetical protein n=1 Tax=Pontibacter sp. E15-1 TaxID=2919918 RepID=UPI001F4F2882|nr:hypothetical protein [Pontibacter sp. E15-1]MCJ8164358.1 hypothetical protein [Pontibacter sp. E15-1]
MKPYLLLFLSTLLLLFALPKNNSGLRGNGGNGQSELNSSCSKSKVALKRTCRKKCIKHQTHSEQQGAASFATDCGQQVYAVLSASDHNASYTIQVERTRFLKDVRIHLPPDLATDPDPPRFS